MRPAEISAGRGTAEIARGTRIGSVEEFNLALASRFLLDGFAPPNLTTFPPSEYLFGTITAFMHDPADCDTRLLKTSLPLFTEEIIVSLIPTFAQSGLDSRSPIPYCTNCKGSEKAFVPMSMLPISRRVLVVKS